MESPYIKAVMIAGTDVLATRKEKPSPGQTAERLQNVNKN